MHGWGIVAKPYSTYIFIFLITIVIYNYCKYLKHLGVSFISILSGTDTLNVIESRIEFQMLSQDQLIVLFKYQGYVFINVEHFKFLS